MEHVDRTAARVSLCAMTGFLGGATYATYKGFPLRATALRVAGSCAIVGTALFAVERLSYVALKEILSNERQLLLTSHAFSGVAAGGINGYLYQRKPLRGMFYFVPTMLAIGYLELAWERTRQERIKQRQAGEIKAQD